MKASSVPPTVKFIKKRGYSENKLLMEAFEATKDLLVSESKQDQYIHDTQEILNTPNIPGAFNYLISNLQKALRI